MYISLIHAVIELGSIPGATPWWYATGKYSATNEHGSSEATELSLPLETLQH